MFLFELALGISAAFGAGFAAGYWKHGADRRHRNSEAAARLGWQEDQMKDLRGDETETELALLSPIQPHRGW